jgi:hypothetical protein
MQKALVLLLASASALLACSGEATDNEQNQSVAPAAPQIKDALPGSGPAPCPIDKAPQAAKPKRTPSPVEQCEGSYDCSSVDAVFGTRGRTFVMHSNGEECQFGTTMVLRTDGTATWTDTYVTAPSPKHGTWKGDSVYFEVWFPNESWSCEP